MKRERNILLKSREYRKLIYSQLFNSLGQILLQVTVMVEVYTRTNSAFGAATVVGVMSIASFISGLIASNIINQYKLKQIMHVSGWLRAALTILIGITLLYSTNYSISILYVILIFYSFITAWYQPARFALLPLTVGKEYYVKANGLLVMIQQTLMTVGWAIGGILNVLFPFTYIVAAITLLFILSGLTAACINVHEKLDKHKKQAAWKKVWTIPIVRSITIMETFEGMANAIWTSALLLSFTHVVLGQGAETWGFINSAYFTGAIIGGVVVTWKSQILEQRIGIMIGLSGLSMGTLTLIFSLNDYVLITLLLCIMMGPMYQARDICQTALLQDVIPEKQRANIMAARSAFLTPWNGIMVMVAGFLADLVGVQLIYILAGILYLLASLIAFQQKSLRDYTFNVVKEDAKKPMKVRVEK